MASGGPQLIAREGMIIESPPFHLFHDVRDVIITSRTDVREMEDDDDDPDLSTFS